jgi:autotransporter-associated beta strand protein
VLIKRASARSRKRWRIALAGASLSAVAAHAQDATWLPPPATPTSDFNNPANWTPVAPPAGPTGTAFFGQSNTTALSFSADTAIGGWTFNTGASNYTFTNGHALDFNGSGIVINGGSATITNNDILRFISSTAGSATIINNFSMGFFDSSTAGSATITNNAGLQFRASTAGSATITNNGSMQFNVFSTGGTARLINGAAGTIDLSDLAASGMTAGSIEGGGRIFLGSANLAVGGNNLSTTFAGVLKDGGMFGGIHGSLTKVGSGTLTLAGINTYTGTTDVSGGTLLVNGSIASSSLTRVNNGGTLGGTGTVGNMQVNSGGTFVPGSGVAGTSMAVMGTLAFQSGAFYLVQINGVSPSFANVTGTASLAGTVQAVLVPGSYAQRSYDILHAAGGLGGTTFGGLSLSTPNFAASLSYTATDVFLNLTAATLGNGTPLNQNQQSVANAINAFFNNGGTLPTGFFALFNLTGGNLANALTSLSGEVATGAQQPAFQLMNEFLDIMLDPFVDGRAGVGGISGGVSRFAPDSEPLPEDIALAYSKVLRTPVYKALPFEQRWSVWGAGYGGANRTSGDPLVVGSHDLSAHTAGGAAGLDYRLAPGTIVGFALAGGGTGWSLAQNLGSGRSDAFQAGIYAKTYSGPFYLAGALAYTQHWMSTDRIAFAGDRLQAQFNAESFGGRAEAGYRIANPIAAVTPYAAVQAQSFHTPTYSETDVTGGGFGLTYNAHNASDTRTELGARFDRPILLNWNAVLALRARVAWAHDWITDPNLIPGFEALPGASFLVQGAMPAKNSALTSAGAELRLVNGISVLAKFDGQFATHSQTYGGSGAVRYVW